MKLDTIKSDCKEIFLDAGNCSVTVNTWSNLEGVSFMLHGKDASIRLAGSLRWEELDALLVALTAARSA